MGSTPYPGTIQDLTFNLFSSLADNRLLANALFWITVWITAKVHRPWTTDRGYWSIFLLRFGCLLGGGADIGCRLLRLRPLQMVDLYLATGGLLRRFELI